MRYATLLAALWLTSSAAFAQAPAAPAAAAGPKAPPRWCRTPPRACLAELDKDREAYRKDPAKVEQLVNKYLLPHFDTEFSARLVLGQYWRTATPGAAQALRRCLLPLTADQLRLGDRRISPPTGSRSSRASRQRDATRATVRTEVKRSNGDRVSVNYYMRKTPEGWKAWDVVIDGISYVNSYREDFGPQIENQGTRCGDQAPGGRREARIDRQAADQVSLPAASAFTLSAAADGRLAAAGSLTFATARLARLAGLAALDAAAAPQRLEIDCCGTRPDRQRRACGAARLARRGHACRPLAALRRPAAGRWAHSRASATSKQLLARGV